MNWILGKVFILCIIIHFQTIAIQNKHSLLVLKKQNKHDFNFYIIVGLDFLAGKKL